MKYVKLVVHEVAKANHVYVVLIFALLGLFGVLTFPVGDGMRGIPVQWLQRGVFGGGCTLITSLCIIRAARFFDTYKSEKAGDFGTPYPGGLKFKFRKHLVEFPDAALVAFVMGVVGVNIVKGFWELFIG